MSTGIKKTLPADTGSVDKKGTSPSVFGQTHQDPSHFENYDYFTTDTLILQGGSG